MSRYAEAVPILEEHLQSPYPWRWVWITLTSILIVCILLALGATVYHQRAHVAYQQLNQLSIHMENQEARLKSRKAPGGCFCHTRDTSIHLTKETTRYRL